MHFKLIIALVDDAHTDAVMEAARAAGATGATVINNTRGEGVEAASTFLGLSLNANRDMLLFLVEEHLSREILETVERVGEFHREGAGIAFQIDVEDAVGLGHQVRELTPAVEDKI